MLLEAEKSRIQTKNLVFGWPRSRLLIGCQCRLTRDGRPFGEGWDVSVIVTINGGTFLPA
jgi:hypothetical protein